MNNEYITSVINSCIGQDIHIVESIIKDLLDKVIPQILQNYEYSRRIVQYTLTELDRVHDAATYIMMAQVLNTVRDVSTKFTKSSNETNDYIDIEWNNEDIKKILEIILPHYKGNFHIYIYLIRQRQKQLHLIKDDNSQASLLIQSSIMELIFNGRRRILKTINYI